MPDIVNLELNPSVGAVKTAGSLGLTSTAKPEVPVEPKVEAAEVKPSPEQPKVDDAKPADDKAAETDPRFQLIAKREREFRAREIATKQMLSKRENELNSRMAKFEAETQEKLNAIDKFNSLAENATKNPEPYLRFVFGDNWYDNATQFKINGRPVPELVQEQLETKLSAEIQQLREEQKQEREEYARRQKVAQQQQLERADRENTELINQHFEETTNYIKQRPDTFELINMQGAQAYQLVNNLTEAWLNQKGELLSPQDAAQRVENYLTEQYKQVYSKSKKFGPSTQVPTETPRTIDQKLTVEPALRDPNKGARTLTNQMTASGPSTFSANKTDQDRVRRAIAAMEALERK